jgi:hypothetical protein
LVTVTVAEPLLLPQLASVLVVERTGSVCTITAREVEAVHPVGLITVKV